MIKDNCISPVIHPRILRGLISFFLRRARPIIDRCVVIRRRLGPLAGGHDKIANVVRRAASVEARLKKAYTHCVLPARRVADLLDDVAAGRPRPDREATLHRAFCGFFLLLFSMGQPLDGFTTLLGLNPAYTLAVGKVLFEARWIETEKPFRLLKDLAQERYRLDREGDEKIQRADAMRLRDGRPLDWLTPADDTVGSLWWRDTEARLDISSGLLQAGLDAAAVLTAVGRFEQAGTGRYSQEDLARYVADKLGRDFSIADVEAAWCRIKLRHPQLREIFKPYFDGRQRY